MTNPIASGGYGPGRGVRRLESCNAPCMTKAANPASSFRDIPTPPFAFVPALWANAAARPVCAYSRTPRSRSALPTTLTLESAMAAAAIGGESSQPNNG